MELQKAYPKLKKFLSNQVEFNKKVIQKLPDRQKLSQVLQQINNVSRSADFSTDSLPQENDILNEIQKRLFVPHKNLNEICGFALKVGLYLLRFEQIRKIVQFYNTKNVTYKILENLYFTKYNKGVFLPQLQSQHFMVVKGKLLHSQTNKDTNYVKQTFLQCKRFVFFQKINKNSLLSLEDTIIFYQKNNHISNMLEQIQEQDNKLNMALLKNCLNFQISSGRLQKIYKKFKVSCKARNSIIFKQGQQEKNIYFILSGQVFIEKTIQGKKYKLMQVMKGALFCSTQLLISRNLPRQSFSLMTSTVCKMLTMQSHQMVKISCETSQIKLKIVRLNEKFDSIIESKLKTIKEIQTKKIQSQEPTFLHCKTTRAIQRYNKSKQCQHTIRSCKPIVKPNQVLMDEQDYNYVVGQHQVIQDYIISKTIVLDIAMHQKQSKQRRKQWSNLLKTHRIVRNDQTSQKYSMIQKGNQKGECNPQLLQVFEQSFEQERQKLKSNLIELFHQIRQLSKPKRLVSSQLTLRSTSRQLSKSRSQQQISSQRNKSLQLAKIKAAETAIKRKLRSTNHNMFRFL